FHQTQRRRHRHLTLFDETNSQGIRNQAPHRSHPPLRELRTLPSHRRQRSRPPLGSQRRTHPHAPVQFPPRPAPHRRRRNFRPRPRQNARQARPHRRRPR